MIIIQNFIQGENYYTMTITERRNAFGVIVSIPEDRPIYLEFMKFSDDGKDIVAVTENDNPEEFNELKDKYFDHVMEYIKSHAN